MNAFLNWKLAQPKNNYGKDKHFSESSVQQLNKQKTAKQQLTLNKNND